MRVQLLSDVHVEFQADGGRTFVSSLDPSGVDVLVLAGDIAVGMDIPGVLGLFCEHYAESQVLYVHGNHEYYGCTREAVVEATRASAKTHSNLTFLDGDVTTISGRRFLGGTLWFPETPSARPFRYAMADFEQIPGFETWVYRENDRMRALLDAELREGDVVVTHHLPSPRCIPEEHADSPLTPFFLCDVESLIVERSPRLWLHGHTHDSVDMYIGDTQLRCNPFGYVGLELNREFDDKAFVDV